MLGAMRSHYLPGARELQSLPASRVVAFLRLRGYGYLYLYISRVLYMYEDWHYKVRVHRHRKKA